MSVAAVTRSLLFQVFGEMVFHYGFVHCDPHPGNMLVRWQPGVAQRRGREQLVVLDHGLYREIDETIRLSYCRLWEAMIMQDQKSLDQVAADLGVPQYAFLFPLIFTNRSLSSKTRLGESMTKEERARVRNKVRLLES